MSEWADKSRTAKVYLLAAVMAGMGASRYVKLTDEQIEARKVLWRVGPNALEWCKAEASRLCDAEYGPNVTGQSEELFHFDPLDV